MAFTMTVSLTGAAFTDEDSGEFEPQAELARILREVANDIGEYYKTNGSITDAYGNVVGSYETVED
jgi:hypothetical protein